MLRTAMRGSGGQGQIVSVDSAGETSGATANVKGSYGQEIASTSIAATALAVVWTEFAAAVGWAIDVAIGAAGVEQIVFPDILWEQNAASRAAGYYIRFPLQIPAGVRISARAQSSTGSKAFQDQVYLILGPPDEPMGQVTAYGVVTSGATTGTSVDPGAVGGVYGSYAQLVASTGQNIRRCWTGCYNQLVGHPDSYLEYQLAIGAGGAEQVILHGTIVDWGLITALVSNGAGCLPAEFDIPAGTRLAARAASGNTVAGTRKIDMAIYGGN